MNKNRLEAFSDGVLAIIITIMVLEIKVPHDTSPQALLNLLPVFISYLLSFVFVGIYWNNHHHFMHTVKRVHPGLMWANMGLLFCLSLIPFSTGWMGENHYAELPVAAYSTNLFLCGFAAWIFQNAITKGLPPTDPVFAIIQANQRKTYFSVALNVVSIVCAFWYPLLSLAGTIIVCIIWLIPDREIERLTEEKHS